MRTHRGPQFGGAIDHSRYGPAGYFFRLFYEDKTVGDLIIIHPHQIAAVELSRSDQIRERMNQGAFDRALQVTRAVLHIRALAEQVTAGFVAHAEDEGGRILRGQNAVLQPMKLDGQDALELGSAQRPEDRDLVD